MSPPRSLAAVAILVSLSLPAAASAQSAGDNQYQDPLAGSQPAAKAAPKPTHSAAPATTGTSTASSPAAPSAPAAPATAPAPSTQAVPLAHTGFDAWKLALAGFVLIAASAALARSARARRN